MKKFLAIALIAASLTSCGGGKTEETPAVDSAATVAPAVDTAAPVAAPATDSAATPAADSAKAAH